MAVVDDHWATVGSSNIDPYSLLMAREANVFVRDAHFADQLRIELLEMIDTGTRPSSPSDWSARVRVVQGGHVDRLRRRARRDGVRWATAASRVVSAPHAIDCVACATALRRPARRPHVPRTRGGDWATIRTLLPYLWEYKGRVLAALACLVLAKVANVGVPVLLKQIVDSLDRETALLFVPFALLVAYGLLRLSTTVFTELREFLFAKVTQRAVRKIALQVFRHLHALSLRFHLHRQTGGLTRDVERGQRGISTLVSYALFSILPTLVEITLVLAILIARYDWTFIGDHRRRARRSTSRSPC